MTEEKTIEMKLIDQIKQILCWSLQITKCSDVFKHGNRQFDWIKIYSFFCGHAIISLTSDVIKYIPAEYAEIETEWKKAVYSNVSTYMRLVKRQEHILKTLKDNKISVVVLKGTSAAKYYSKPQQRTMGDIDLLVKPEDYDKTVECLISVGCAEIIHQTEDEKGRHRSFVFNDTEIELHRFFSSKYMEAGEAKALDNLLYDSILLNSTELPDEENGLVLLSHIRLHLKNGLGLRQIIDWFMFVRACLDDEMWYSSFQEKARITGLEMLAITVTRMCQIYLGLTTENVTWCKDADEKTCSNLMQYVMDCGNFGRSRDMLQSSAVEKLPSIKHPIQFFKYIQSHGETNWKALKKHPWLKPFAWIYQSCRYIKLAVQNKVTPNKLKAIYDEGNKRNEMFAALGLK